MLASRASDPTKLPARRFCRRKRSDEFNWPTLALFKLLPVPPPMPPAPPMPPPPSVRWPAETPDPTLRLPKVPELAEEPVERLAEPVLDMPELPDEP